MEKRTKRRARTPLQWIEEFAVPEPNSGCWLWTGSISKDTRYGVMSYQSPSGQVSTNAHRVAYEVYVGPIPPGLHIDHLCRNRTCVNPDHLEAVTQRVNNLRAPGSVSAVNAAKTHCNRGHPLTGANLYIRPISGLRNCRACQGIAQRAYRARKAGLS